MIERIPQEEAEELYAAEEAEQKARAAVDEAIARHHQAVGVHQYVAKRIGARYSLTGGCVIGKDGTVKAPPSAPAGE